MNGNKATSEARARRRRADAERNTAAIVGAAITCLTRDPDASVADIAQAAGVGRVTLYGHFNSRAALVDAALARAVADADATLDELDLDSVAPDEALERLVASSWRILHRFRALMAAAHGELAPERIRLHHDQPLGRVRNLLQRGQRDGVFRTDLPLEWLVAVFHSVLHTAAAEITAGRLGTDEAGDLITPTLLSALRR